MNPRQKTEPTVHDLTNAVVLTPCVEEYWGWVALANAQPSCPFHFVWASSWAELASRRRSEERFLLLVDAAIWHQANDAQMRFLRECSASLPVVLLAQSSEHPLHVRALREGLMDVFYKDALTSVVFERCCSIWNDFYQHNVAGWLETSSCPEQEGGRGENSVISQFRFEIQQYTSEQETIPSQNASLVERVRGAQRRKQEEPKEEEKRRDSLGGLDVETWLRKLRLRLLRCRGGSLLQDFLNAQRGPWLLKQQIRRAAASGDVTQGVGEIYRWLCEEFPSCSGAMRSRLWSEIAPLFREVLEGFVTQTRQEKTHFPSMPLLNDVARLRLHASSANCRETTPVPAFQFDVNLMQRWTEEKKKVVG